ncbi:MAG: hypothetical protein NT056_07400 [Proteobacteria bacterium]|nr:hypothetical protein [Pseudomonadota bacterium]
MIFNHKNFESSVKRLTLGSKNQNIAKKRKCKSSKSQAQGAKSRKVKKPASLKDQNTGLLATQLAVFSSGQTGGSIYN